MKFRRGEIVTVQQKTIGIRDSMSPKREGIISPGTVGTVRAVSTRKLIGIPEKSVLVDFPSLIDERWVRPGDLQHGNPSTAWHKRNPTRRSVAKPFLSLVLVGGLAWLIYKYRS